MNVDQTSGRATQLRVRSVAAPHMRTFHLTWLAFFLSVFAWFGLAPLMPVVRDDLGLSDAQVYNTVIASVALAIVARIAIGWVIDRVGPRRTYAVLLILGSLPVMAVGLAQSYEAFLLFRLAIGAIGAAFVVTQYHTSVMFAPTVVGTANATAAGWGNLGGGLTQLAMPALLATLLLFGLSEPLGWRLTMILPGLALFAMGFAYYRWIRDTPRGDLREQPPAQHSPPLGRAGVFAVARDRRVWSLFIVYAACFGIELTINNVAALYFHDRFEVGVLLAGAIASLFGCMNLFARSLGGLIGDRCGVRWGPHARIRFLCLVLLAEGLALILFSRMDTLLLAIPALAFASLLVQASSGATFAVVPFVNTRALGAVAGIVGAGGNVGAVAAGVLFRLGVAPADGFLIIGLVVLAISPIALTVRLPGSGEAIAERSPASASAVPSSGGD